MTTSTCWTKPTSSCLPVYQKGRWRACRLRAACFEAVGCEGLARVDFLKDEKTGEMFINEINTIPGFTSISMYPKMWEYSGVPYRTLLDTLIDLACERGKIRRQLQYSR